MRDKTTKRIADREWRKNNPDKVRESRKKFNEAHPGRQKELHKRWRDANREKINAEARERYWKDPNKRNKICVKSNRKRMENNPILRVLSGLRTTIVRAIHNASGQKNSSFSSLLGCDTNFLKTHLERQFSDGMTWENYGFGEGKWVVDHIVPCSLFPDLTKEWQQKSCFNWQNLQPLWWLDNLRKKDKLETCPV